MSIGSKVLKLLDLMDFEWEVTSSLESILNDSEGANHVDREQIRRLVSIQDFKERVASVYGEHFDETEIDSAISFYNSPAGGKFVTRCREIHGTLSRMTAQFAERTIDQFQNPLEGA